MRRRANHDLIEIACVLVHQTELAYLLDCGGEKPAWLPKSTCELDVDERGAGTVELSERYATEKGLI